jgi:hypothetical protein
LPGNNLGALFEPKKSAASLRSAKAKRCASAGNDCRVFAMQLGRLPIAYRGAR